MVKYKLLIVMMLLCRWIGLMIDGFINIVRFNVECTPNFSFRDNSEKRNLTQSWGIKMRLVSGRPPDDGTTQYPEMKFKKSLPPNQFFD